MPVIKRPATQRGVIIDGATGIVLSEIKWLAGEGKPVLKRENNRRRQIITDLAGFKSAAQRWDRVQKAWIDPPLNLFVVQEATGALIRQIKTWPDAIPDLPEGYALVDDKPPKQAGRSKALYNFTSQSWGYARRMAIINPEGIVENVVLENPEDSKPNIELPKGYSREDSDGEGFPRDEYGDEIRIGHRLARGVWLPKEDIKVKAES
jgi:hypothetical protein